MALSYVLIELVALICIDLIRNSPLAPTEANFSQAIHANLMHEQRFVSRVKRIGHYLQVNWSKLHAVHCDNRKEKILIVLLKLDVTTRVRDS